MLNRLFGFQIVERKRSVAIGLLTARPLAPGVVTELCKPSVINRSLNIQDADRGPSLRIKLFLGLFFIWRFPDWRRLPQPRDLPRNRCIQLGVRGVVLVRRRHVLSDRSDLACCRATRTFRNSWSSDSSCCTSVTQISIMPYANETMKSNMSK